MSDILERLALVLEERKQAEPDSSYVARLYANGGTTGGDGDDTLLSTIEFTSEGGIVANGQPLQ